MNSLEITTRVVEFTNKIPTHKTETFITSLNRRLPSIRGDVSRIHDDGS